VDRVDHRILATRPNAGGLRQNNVVFAGVFHRYGLVHQLGEPTGALKRYTVRGTVELGPAGCLVVEPEAAGADLFGTAVEALIFTLGRAIDPTGLLSWPDPRSRSQPLYKFSKFLLSVQERIQDHMLILGFYGDPNAGAEFDLSSVTTLFAALWISAPFIAWWSHGSHEWLSPSDHKGQSGRLACP
jgi:hypothetical protein